MLVYHSYAFNFLQENVCLVFTGRTVFNYNAGSAS